MNDYDNCKCKRCGKECGRIYIARTRIGEYCIMTGNANKRVGRERDIYLLIHYLMLELFKRRIK